MGRGQWGCLESQKPREGAGLWNEDGGLAYRAKSIEKKGAGPGPHWSWSRKKFSCLITLLLPWRITDAPGDFILNRNLDL